MVVEAAPLVVGDDEHGAGPGRAVGEGVEHLGQEGVAGADVGVGMVVVGATVGVADEARVHEGDVGEGAGTRVGQELLVGPGDRLVPGAPQAEERQVGVVVAPRRPARPVELVPDGRHRRRGVGVADPVRLGRVEEQAVGVRRPEEGTEVGVARREVAGQGGRERPVGLGVEPDGVVVVAAPAEVVHRPGVELEPPAGVGMVGIGMPAAHRVGEVVVGPRHALLVGVARRQDVLGAVGARQPTEEVVEAAVLHHDHDDVLDPALRMAPARPGRVGPRRRHPRRPSPEPPPPTGGQEPQAGPGARQPPPPADPRPVRPLDPHTPECRHRTAGPGLIYLSCRERRRATAHQIASTTPKGQAPDRNP